MKYQSTVSINQKDICIQFNLEANMIRNKEERKSGKDIVISSVISKVLKKKKAGSQNCSPTTSINSGKFREKMSYIGKKQTKNIH